MQRYIYYTSNVKKQRLEVTCIISSLHYNNNIHLYNEGDSKGEIGRENRKGSYNA